MLIEEAFFEVKHKDVLGRIGRLKTAHGVVETPAFAPVINPIKNVLSPAEIAEMGFPLLMTNAFIIYRNYREVGAQIGVHKILGVNTPIMTDSGAYQLMEYGYVDVKPEDIVRYEEELGADIGVILDIPTRYYMPREQVVLEVEETLRRARRSLALRREAKMLLLAPVQGGRNYDLVEYSAKALAKLPFDLYGVGGPTQIMEHYKFSELARLVLTAKRHLPLSKPLHLFGAGHPMIFSLMVALGVDLFDSASYALYAKDGRYLTPQGTYRFEDLSYLPCRCPVCSKHDVEELKELSAREREKLLAKHNLYVILAEMNTIKQAITEGELWNLVEMRAGSHPSLKSALITISEHVDFLEEHSPITFSKVTGIFFTDTYSLGRLEVYRHVKRLRDSYRLTNKRVVLLLPETEEKPFHRFGPISKFLKRLLQEFRSLTKSVEILVYTRYFGLIPITIDDIYPLSQYEVAQKTAKENVDFITKCIREFLLKNQAFIKAIVACVNEEFLKGYFTGKLKRLSSSMGIPIELLYINVDELHKDETFYAILSIIAKYINLPK